MAEAVRTKPEFVKLSLYCTEYLSAVSTFKIPKVRCSDSVRLRGFVKEFGEKYFTTDGIILFCKLYEVKVTAKKRFTAQQQCNTAKHKSCVNREFATESRQQLLFQKSHSSSSILGSAYEFS
jgi:hypothetical protein